MPYNKAISDRIRERLADHPIIEEKEMMGGVVFMVNEKMCVGVIKDEMMCRIDPEFHNAALEMSGCRTMDFTKRPMIGYVLINEDGMKNKNDFEFWIHKALEFNIIAKSSKKKK
jgi:TfoX/Sxy family transcriptional regulator of competence genes